jgi:hypothetical protein
LATKQADADVENVAASTNEWETVVVGLGDEWDFERNGSLVGNYLGTTTVETTKVDSGEATAFRFRVGNDDVFVWGSSEIERAFSRKIPDTDDPIIALGDRVKIDYLGIDQFTGAKGPMQIKRYRVAIPKAGQPRA